MKLTEQDKRDACKYIMQEACKAAYGDDYEKLGFCFDFRRMPITVREIVDFFIDWLKIRIENEKNNRETTIQTQNTQKS